MVLKRILALMIVMAVMLLNNTSLGWWYWFSLANLTYSSPLSDFCTYFTVDGLASIMGIRNRDVRREYHSQHKRIGILNLSGTSILIEFCFITNAADMRAYKANEQRIAKFVAELIKNYDKND